MNIYTPLCALIFCASALPAAAATPPDPCATLHKAEAASALGAPIVKVQSRSLGPSRTCTMRANGFFKSVLLTTFRWDGVPQAQAAFHSMIATTATMMKPLLLVHGLGDEAQRVGANIYVRKGTAAYVFNVIDGSVGDVKAARTQAFARKTMMHVKG